MGSIAHVNQVSTNLHASKEAPNILINGGLQDWSAGVSSQPDNWTDEGSPIVSRDTGERDNWNATPYSVEYRATGAANEGGYYTFSNLKANTKYGVHVRAKATAGDTARILTTGASIDIDTETVLTVWTDLYGTFETNGTPADVILKLVAKADGDIVWFCKIMVVEGNVIPTFAPRSGIISPNTDLEVNSLGVGVAPTGTTGTIKLPSSGWIGLDAGSARIVFSSGTARFSNITRVGINISPTYNLHTAISNTSNILAIDTYDNNDQQFSQIRLRKSNTDTIGSAVPTNDGDDFGMILFLGVNTSNAFIDSARIVARQTHSDASYVWSDLKFGVRSYPTSPFKYLSLNGDGTATLEFDTTIDGALYLTERASAKADIAGKGQIWVKNTAPNKLYFTNDVGADVQLGVSAGAGDTIERTFTEATHGFAVKDVVMFDGTNWVKAQADSAANAESPWVVKSVTTNTFVAVWSGYISGLSGLSAGTVYFLDDDTAGLLTTTEPTDIDDVSLPMLIALSATTGVVLNKRGMVVTGGTTYWDEIRDADNDTGIRAEQSADEDKLRFRTAGSERMQIDETGAVFMPDVYSDGVTADIDVVMQSDGQLGFDASSIRYKKNIREIDNVDWLYDLHSVVYDKKDGRGKDIIGLIAEEVSEINQKIVCYKRVIDDEGLVSQDLTQPETVIKSRLIVPILKAVQDLRKDVDSLMA